MEKEKIYVLVEDRRWNNEKVVFCTIGTEDECFEWVLLNTPFSNAMAMNEQGYKKFEII